MIAPRVITRKIMHTSRGVVCESRQSALLSVTIQSKRRLRDTTLQSPQSFIERVMQRCKQTVSVLQ